MSDAPPETGIRIVRDNRTFRELYPDLRAGDVVVGLLNLKPTEESLFLDLSERGVRLFPPALAQHLSRSKCLQAMVLGRWMVPDTFVARDRHDLVRQLNRYGARGHGAVVTKQNRFNCGLGIHRWESLEAVYNQACFGSLAYPFVVQPFLEGARDIRVVILGDYVEAYWRENPNSFRNNLFFGGRSGHHRLTPEQEALCRDAMARGRFPYAHVDLLVAPDGTAYLSEINLRGGLKGARIDHRAYQEKIEELNAAFLREVTGEAPPAEPRT
ncbi:ATP-grasp domain-containing protein [Dissulfurirhabdus thermomarina]|uniref:ATP-grasp domain-containing protein n=1 Tax=Dissulfurirhabdus thermomarina TaxID=1765737 RepID=UPI001FE619B1|nr:hypothetical protein [Dissulfurirhabdus thermomarina]